MKLVETDIEIEKWAVDRKTAEQLPEPLQKKYIKKLGELEREILELPIDLAYKTSRIARINRSKKYLQIPNYGLYLLFGSLAVLLIYLAVSRYKDVLKRKILKELKIFYKSNK
jgi:hypothetical protein